MDSIATSVQSLPKKLYNKIYEFVLGIAPTKQQESEDEYDGQPVEASRIIFVSNEMLGTYVPGIGFCDCENAVAVTPRAVNDLDSDVTGMGEYTVTILDDAVLASTIEGCGGSEDGNSRNEGEGANSQTIAMAHVALEKDEGVEA